MNEAKHVKLLVIGSGPAGYTAAIYAARAGLDPVLVAGLQLGGQLTTTTLIENFPGFPEGIDGTVLMDLMRRQAEHVGTELVYDIVTSVDLSKRPFFVRCDGGADFLAESLIIATGAQARWLGIPSEEMFKGAGVSACATCDGFFYKGKRVAVVGGGNSAMEEALFLTNFAEHVTLIHRRDSFRGEKVMQERVLAHPKITVKWNRVVEEVLGEEDQPKRVTGLRLAHPSGSEIEELSVSGLFVAIGHTPATALFKDQLPLDSEGYITTAPDSTTTAIPGVFAAGDVKDRHFRQAITSAGMGCMAALEAERFLSSIAISG
ncbi:MAG TPA: thioredoxin-disulfide reductase [Rhodospirillaceae bacterium]|nr:MAG: thioredoxin-disulfide reductase [Alphaproteobacteria bacterium GWF2_58_20]HAU29302.1 thioredoxin-disulfide reductase [Rhodospirillaceae bacterium]